MQEYAIEARLRQLDPDLHRRFTDTVFMLERASFKYQRLFPEYTDHSILHNITVVHFCNRLIGDEQLRQIGPNALYSLLMACCLHDVGMGISQKDYEEFCPQIRDSAFRAAHPDARVDTHVREFHQDFSGLYIRKYADFLEIPSPEHLFAVVQIARGHRRTDLFDETEYPADYRVRGEAVFLPYFAALIRLADEVDVMASRNPVLLYDIEALTDDLQVFEYMKVRAVKDLIVTPDSFRMIAEADSDRLAEALDGLRAKMQRTLDYCREAAEKRSPFRITQQRVELSLTRV